MRWNSSSFPFPQYDKPNVMHPMNQGFIECIKKKCRHRLLQSLLESTEGEGPTCDFLKKTPMKDEVDWVIK